MTPLLEGLEKGIKKICEVLLVPCFLLMLTANLLQVIYRYVLQQPLAWSEELSRYLFIYASYLGAVIAVADKKHIELDIIQMVLDKLQLKTRIVIERGIAVIRYLLLIGFLGCLTYLAYINLEEIMEFDQHSPALGVNMVIPISSVLVACGLMGLLYAKMLVGLMLEVIQSGEVRGDSHG